jgi:hypothetical protein
VGSYEAERMRRWKGGKMGSHGAERMGGWEEKMSTALEERFT